jgi:glycine/D-amino acid oxidase-like deaminating enzyme
MTTSVWLDRDADRPRPAPLESDASADVALVGGGIAGIACAHALASSGASVIVLERDDLASGASGRNAGFVLGGVAENYVAACRRYGEKRAMRIFRTTFDARALLRAAIDQAGVDCEARWDGSDQIAGSDGEWEETATSAARLAAAGERVAIDPLARRVTFADDGCLDPVRFVRGLAAAAAAGGARIHARTPAVGVGPGTVLTARGRVTAGAVVLCTGAYTAHLATARIRPVRGQMLATAPIAPGRFPRPTYAHRGYRYWRQTDDGRVLVGGWRDRAEATEVGEDDRTSPVIQDALDGWLREQGISAPVTHRWGGTMDFSHDGLPYVGRRADGLFVCGGFTGHGNGFAMAAAQILAALVRTGGHSDADLFDPERA